VIGIALGATPCFTPAESLESKGMAEASFVKACKREYFRVKALRDAARALTVSENG
jgi:hypothetical protein